VSSEYEMVGLYGFEIQHTRTRLHVVITKKTAVCSENLKYQNRRALVCL